MYQLLSLNLVEARGVEPLSEREPTKASPSAVCALDFVSRTATNSLLGHYLDKIPLIPPRIGIKVSY